MLPQTKRTRQDEQTKNAGLPASSMVQSQNMDEGNNDFGTKPVEYPVRTIQGLHFGDYTFEQVTADLIDNSIDAGASHVEVILDSQDMGPEKKEYDMGMQGPNKLYCIVLDDGKGIGTIHRLREVMSRGVTRPEDNPYQEHELGAFGVGLKESALAQAYEVTFFTKQKGGEMLIMRLSSHAIKKHGRDILLRESELEPWMRETKGFSQCLSILGDQECGSALLLEGMHKMELEIGEGDRSVFLDDIEERVTNYLGLVFYYYLTGAKVPLSDGRTIDKKIEISYCGRRNTIRPLDPFCREWETGLRDGTISRSTKIDTLVGNEIKKLGVTAWFLAHSSVKGRKGHQDRMKSTKREASSSSMQGVYVFRNMRLVEFCSSDDPWKGILTRHDNQVFHRWEIHLPPGLSSGTSGPSFRLNTSKSQVKFSVDVRKALRNWGSRPGVKWHDDDPRIVSARDRGEIRNGRVEKWKKCKKCGSETHTASQCKSPPLGQSQLSIGANKPNSNLKSKNTKSPDTKRPKLTKVEVKRTDSGDVLSSREDGEKLVVSINKKHHLYEDLMDKLNDF